MNLLFNKAYYYLVIFHFNENFNPNYINKGDSNKTEYGMLSSYFVLGFLVLWEQLSPT